MTPLELVRAMPAHGSVRGLHDRWGVYACSLGIWRPWVAVDRKAETMPGFDALIYHESLHATEWHALLGLSILLAGAVEFAAAVVLELWLSALLGPLVAIVLWALWKREAETRADAIALYGAGRGSVSDEDPRLADPTFRTALTRQGLLDFRNFLRMHPNGGTNPELTWAGRAWEAWKYGRTIAHRELRAMRRCRRLGWEVRETPA